jgi:hypothetical protein
MPSLPFVRAIRDRRGAPDDLRTLAGADPA